MGGLTIPKDEPSDWLPSTKWPVLKSYTYIQATVNGFEKLYLIYLLVHMSQQLKRKRPWIWEGDGSASERIGKCNYVLIEKYVLLYGFRKFIGEVQWLELSGITDRQDCEASSHIMLIRMQTRARDKRNHQCTLQVIHSHQP